MFSEGLGGKLEIGEVQKSRRAAGYKITPGKACLSETSRLPSTKSGGLDLEF